jgi:N-acetylglutamate synthase-like GNAT family acetyltransferase
MIKIKLLAQFPNYLPDIAKIWVNIIGKAWVPNVSLEQCTENLKTHLNEDILPLSYVAIDDNTSIGMCCLRMDDGISRHDLFPWLGSLCVTEAYRKRGIGKLLVTTIKIKAYKMGFKKLYLFTFDQNIADWYAKNGWKQMPDQAFIDSKKVILMEIVLSKAF